jgi:kinetochore protein NDC80
MNKDFFEIFKFLIGHLDPLLEIDGKVEDEVPLIMRRLKYPVEVNRSKLQSISGPNTWPQLLAVLDWLIALILVNESLVEPVAECKVGIVDADTDCETDHHTLRTLHENYFQFLSGKDDNSVEERLRQIYEERIQGVQYETERLHEQTAGMENQVQEFRAEHDRLLELQAAPRQLEIEADRLRGVIQAQDARAQRSEEESATVEGEADTLVGEIEGLEAKARELQEQVDKQAYSKKDIDRLKQERAHLRSMLQDLKSDAEKADQNVWELGIQESSLEESISRSLRYINDKAETVEEPVSAVGGPCVQELLIQVDLAESTDALAAFDFSELGARVDTAAEAHEETTRKEEQAQHEVADEQRVVQEELSEKDREIKRLKVRVEQVTRMREEYRVWSESQLDDARRIAEEVEDNVRMAATGTAGPSLRETAEVDDLRLRLNELISLRDSDRSVMEEKLRREQESREKHQQAVQKEIQLALDSMEQLRLDVEKRVAELLADDKQEIQQSRTASRGGS